MKHYLKVTDRQFSEAAGVAQGVAPAQVIGNQGISENSPTQKNKAYHVMSFHVMPAKGGQVGDEGLHPISFEAFKKRAFVHLPKTIGVHADFEWFYRNGCQEMAGAE